MNTAYKVMAATAFAGVIAMLFTVIPSMTQQSGPAAVNGCIYISGGITLSNRQTAPFQCDVNGRLRVTTAAP